MINKKLSCGFVMPALGIGTYSFGGEYECDEHMFVRTKQDKILAEKNKSYSGLFATLMEHNTPNDINCLIEKLDKEAHKINKQKIHK